MSSITYHKQVNTIPVRPVIGCLLIVFIIALLGLCFVLFKNKQHALGDKVHQLENQLVELRSECETLTGKITQMTGPDAIRRRLKLDDLSLVPIADGAIARVGDQGVGDAMIQVAQVTSGEGLRR